MTARFATCVFAVFASVVLASAAIAVDDKDIIIYKNGQKRSAYIETENMSGVYYRTTRSASTSGAAVVKPNLEKLNVLETIVYYGMDSGPYAKGVSEREAGNFEAAAQFFNQAALVGSREWEKVYGFMNEGQCWELARKYEEAAKAYALVVEGFAGDPNAKPPIPPHRKWLDAKYYLGMALAQAKDANATEIANQLETQGRKEGLNPIEARAYAIRTAISAGEGNANQFNEFMKKTSLRPLEEPDVWFHFKLYCAEANRMMFRKGKEAASIYNEILANLRNEPARQAQVSLGLGLTLIDNDKPSALIELLKLDVLPYGSPDQKCEARYNAGRLLWDEAQQIKNNAQAMKDERKAQFVIDTERAARLVVSAAADGPANNPNAELAKVLLMSFGEDPDARKEEPKKEVPKAAEPKKEEPKKKKK
jgi:hypothetical protein